MLYNIMLFLSYINFFIVGYYLSKMVKDDLRTKYVRLKDLQYTLTFLSFSLLFYILIYKTFFDVFNSFFTILYVFITLILILITFDESMLKSFKKKYEINFADLSLILQTIFFIIFFSFIVKIRFFAFFIMLVFFIMIITFYLSSIVDYYIKGKISLFEVQFLHIISPMLLLSILFILIDLFLRGTVEWNLVEFLTKF